MSTSEMNDVGEESYRKTIAKVSWRLLPFMFLLYIISFLDRINISFAAAAMMRELNFDEEVMGFGLGVFFFGYCIFGVPSNLMLQKIGARKWITIIMVLWGMVSVAMAFVPDKKCFFFMRFLLGIAESGFFPGMIYYLTKWFRRREHGLAVAKFMSAIPAAGLIGAFVAARVLAMPAYFGLAPWKWLFIVTGAPAVIFGMSVYFYLTDGPESTSWLSDDEKRLLKEKLEADQDELKNRNYGTANAASGDAHQSADPVRATLCLPSVWLFALLYFTLTLAMYGFQLWLPQIINNQLHAGDSETALWTALPASFQAIGMVVVAKNSDRTGERRFHLCGAALAAAAGLAIAAMNGGQASLIAGLCLTAFGIWGTVGPFWAMPTGYLTGTAAATGIGLINSVGNLGGFVGPYIVGAIKKHSTSFSTSLTFMAASLILASVLAFVLGSRKKNAG